MDFNNCSNDSEWVEKYLQHLEDRNTTIMIPAVVMMVGFIVTGLVGNILVLLVYSKKMRLSPTKVLIMTIATFDLVSNVGAIPSEMYIMLDSWNFSLTGVCKLKVFLGSFTTVGGAISLCVVAVIRYRKVCRHSGWQVSIRQAVIASILVAITSFLFSIPYIIIYGIRTRQTPCPGIQGHECFADDYYFYTNFPLLNNILFVLLYLSLSVTMVVLYIFIGVTAWKHSSFHGTSDQTTKIDNNNSTSGLSSTDNDPIVSSEEAEKTEFSNSSNRKKATSLVKDKFKTLMCCLQSEEEVKNEDETPSSIEMKNCTASSDLETGEDNSDSVTADVNFAETGEKVNLRLETKACHGFDCTNVGFSEQCAGSGTDEVNHRFNQSESKSTTEGQRARSYYLATTEDVKVSCPEKGKDVSKSNCNHQNTNTAIKIKQKPVAPTKKTSKRRPLGRMTAMLIIISAIFVLGYFPFLTLTVVKNKLPEKYESLSTAESTVFNFFYRLYFLNSAVNPIVYSLCDLNFRRECIKLLTCRSNRHL